MKIRLGFVSNSSSSSFIICVTKAERCKHCGRTDSDFLNMLESDEDGENIISASGMHDIMRYLREDWCLEELLLEDLEKKLKAVKKGELHMVSLSNHSSLMSRFQDGEFKNVKILESLGD